MKKSKLFNEVTVKKYNDGKPVEYTVNRTVSLTDEEANALNTHHIKGANVEFIPVNVNDDTKITEAKNELLKSDIEEMKFPAMKSLVSRLGIVPASGTKKDVIAALTQAKTALSEADAESQV